MPLARSGVDLVSDGVAMVLVDPVHVVTFGEILADESVGVFVGASLPGVVGGCEVAGYKLRLFDLLVVVELGAIVEGDCAELVVVLFDSLNRSCSRDGCSSGS